MKISKIKKSLVYTGLATFMLTTTLGTSVNAMVTTIYRGSTRVEVSMETSKQAPSNHLIMVSANAFADALSAGNIAQKTGGHIIMVYKTTDITTYLSQTKPEKITIVGGPLSMSGTPVRQAYEYTKNIEIIQGATRYDVNEETLKKYDYDKVVVADGRNFPDALSSSGYLAKNGIGLMLVDGSKEYSNDGREILYTLGGELSVKYATNTRIGGQTRYDASININNLVQPDKVVVSVGNVFSDAISSINMVTANKALTTATIVIDENQTRLTPQQREYISKAKEAIIVGGRVKQTVIDEISLLNTGVNSNNPDVQRIWVPEKGIYDNYKLLKVAQINQYDAGAPMGCEASSLLQGLHYKGYAKDKNIYIFLREMPIASDNNPYHGFAGSPFKVMYGVYQSIFPEPLANWGKKYGNVENISGKDLNYIKDEISKGNPVVFFGTYDFAKPEYNDYFWGKNAIDNAHVMLADGYDSGRVHIVDPAKYDKDGYWVSNATFSNAYNLKRYAVVIR